MSKHYQQKFIDEKEARQDAKEKSKLMKKKVAVIKSKKLYYVDTNIEPMRDEVQVCVYMDGKLAKKI